jgi:uncharacterized protein YjbI with pentapeptide repeats
VLIENADYHDPTGAIRALADNVLRYCSFASLLLEGAHVDVVCLGCKFENVEWYWGLFNDCTFVDSRFVRCTFRGASFPDCRFVDCEFVECRFIEDNLGGSCQAERAHLYGTSFTDCIGAEALFGVSAPSVP